jgi:PhzF family phenazine biosynthesis protein
MARPLRLVDVFTTEPYRGNPVAVVLDGAGVDTEEMQRFAHWMNLSETTFVLAPEDPSADYRLRIFTPVAELPFAGHPTLGSAHAWLEAGGTPKAGDVIVQECGVGLVTLRRTPDGLAFAAPPRVRTGPVEEPLVERAAGALGIERAGVVEAQWVDNGPGWMAVMLPSAADVLKLRPGLIDLDLGVVGAYPDGSPEAFEVRAFFLKDGSTVEDPVTGSLNASLAQWLLESGRASAPYTASQGTALGRRGRVHITTDDEGAVWVAGGTVTCGTGEIDI